MKRGVREGVLLSAALLTLVGCTSSGSSSEPVGASTPPATTTSVPAPPTTPTPAPKPSAPLSPYEQDPAVKAMRAWMAEAARTVNTGHYTSAALAKLMTTQLNTTMNNVLGGDVGLQYPGPIPVTPTAVHAVSATQRQMRLCVVGTGFAQKPSTHRPAAGLSVVPIDAAAVLSSGRWVLSRLDDTSAFSCRGVTIKKPIWS